MDFCTVLQHKKQLVYTRMIYSGVDEYWSARPEKGKCKNIKAELLIPDSVEIQPQFLRFLKDVHEHYWDRYLIIDAIGTYDDSRETVYGHLGSNHAQFVVKQLIDVQQVIRGKKKAVKLSSH